MEAAHVGVRRQAALAAAKPEELGRMRSWRMKTAKGGHRFWWRLGPAQQVEVSLEDPRTSSKLADSSARAAEVEGPRSSGDVSRDALEKMRRSRAKLADDGRAFWWRLGADQQVEVSLEEPRGGMRALPVAALASNAQLAAPQTTACDAPSSSSPPAATDTATSYGAATSSLEWLGASATSLGWLSHSVSTTSQTTSANHAFPWLGASGGLEQGLRNEHSQVARAPSPFLRPEQPLPDERRAEEAEEQDEMEACDEVRSQQAACEVAPSEPSISCASAQLAADNERLREEVCRQDAELQRQAELLSQLEARLAETAARQAPRQPGARLPDIRARVQRLGREVSRLQPGGRDRAASQADQGDCGASAQSGQSAAPIHARPLREELKWENGRLRQLRSNQAQLIDSILQQGESEAGRPDGKPSRQDVGSSAACISAVAGEMRARSGSGLTQAKLDQASSAGRRP